MTMRKMMTDHILEIIENQKIAPDVFEMELACPEAPEAPGQFVDIAVPGFYLRRPFSVADYEDGVLRIVYKTVGSGTKEMSAFHAGGRLNTIFYLGNGYDISKAGGDIYVVGGGLGIPPLYYLTKKLREAGREVTAVLGFNTSSEIFYKDDFEALGARTVITTADGSAGTGGFVTAAMPERCDYVFSCGPQAMLRAVYDRAADGQFSFEARMGCGFGVCMGCSVKTKNGPKRICKDGPVFGRSEIIWPTQE
ncbi:MAG: dihydroorotate dehydrogenase electron transfer subunit [Anaerovoracaceae bacterium]|nr:dihydroorotate dehydrogenase electron transfer subunit [Anaerovoracaceae bacterium]